MAIGLLALLPSCYGGMMIVAAGLAMEESRASREAKREAKKRDKLISKLPREEQAVARLGTVPQNKFDISGGSWMTEEKLVDKHTMLNITKMVALSGNDAAILKAYDDHFAEYGYHRITPPAAEAVRSYGFKDYRVDLRLVTPSERYRSKKYTDMEVRVYSPREAAENRMR